MTGTGVNPTCMLPEVKAKPPVRDPNSTKYPDRRFYRGQWLTEAQAERERKLKRERERERYHSDPEYRERELKRRAERKRERYWSDPFFPLHAQQRGREWRALQREEQPNGR